MLVHTPAEQALKEAVLAATNDDQVGGALVCRPKQRLRGITDR